MADVVGFETAFADDEVFNEDYGCKGAGPVADEAEEVGEGVVECGCTNN